MRKTLILAALGAAVSLAALPARAGGNVYWSVGISAPVGYSGAVGTVISNAPVYAPAPVYVAPPPVYYAPPPVVYYQSPPVVVAPRPYYYAPAPVVYGAPVYVPRHRHHRGNYDYRRDHYYGPIS